MNPLLMSYLTKHTPQEYAQVSTFCLLLAALSYLVSLLTPWVVAFAITFTILALIYAIVSFVLPFLLKRAVDGTIENEEGDTE